MACTGSRCKMPTRSILASRIARSQAISKLACSSLRAVRNSSSLDVASGLMVALVPMDMGGSISAAFARTIASLTTIFTTAASIYHGLAAAPAQHDIFLTMMTGSRNPVQFMPYVQDVNSNYFDLYLGDAGANQPYPISISWSAKLPCTPK